MSTNEQNKKQEVVQNGNFKKSETLFSLENRSSNSVKSEFKSGEKRGGEATDVVFNENEETLQSRGKSLESSCNAIDNTKINQTPNQQENQVIIEDSNQSPSEEILKSSGEETTSPEEMSRSSVKSRLPSKTTSRSGLSNINSKVSGELSGQPSMRSAKDDIKYWKNREQELLSKIAELERKLTNKELKAQGPQEAIQGQFQEKLENDSLVIKENCKSRTQSIDKESYKRQKDIPAEGNYKHIKGLDEVTNHLKLQNEDLRNALAKMTTILRDKTTLCISQEKKLAALVNQVESLKEVVAITKDLLNIRNMEVQHLSNDITAMESKIDCERQRHNQMLIKMDEAVKLNSELKKEYENQLKLFQHLRDSYEEKILLLSRDSSKKGKPFENHEKQENLSVDKGIVNSNKPNSDSHVQSVAL